MDKRVKLAVATPRVWLGDVRRNTDEILRLVREAAAADARVIVFPKEALSGASCGSLAAHPLMRQAVSDARARILSEGAAAGIEVVLDSCRRGKLLMICAAQSERVSRWDKTCAALQAYCRQNACSLALANAGYGESTTDCVWGGGSLVIDECGSQIASGARFHRDSRLIYAEVPWPGEAPVPVAGLEDLLPATAQKPPFPARPNPFIPEDAAELACRCDEIFEIQTMALATRLEHIHSRSAVIGVSGGLDSTLALLVAVRAADALGWSRSQVIGVTMPGFGTSDHTHGNASALMQVLGVTMRDISIVPSVTQHLQDIGHPLDRHDTTYENAQARERTQILMDIAGDEGGLVVGTGDLSELALGWCTFNGDHMAMYGVNAGLPKTLMREMVRHAAAAHFPEAAPILVSVLETPISPELLPGVQPTEDIVGPYDLHDFFLYALLRQEMSPREILEAAVERLAPKYDRETIAKWLPVFLRRFFAQQFKRNCGPDGPQIGSVCLSPRGDFKMPSDLSGAVWMDELAG